MTVTKDWRYAQVVGDRWDYEVRVLRWCDSDYDTLYTEHSLLVDEAKQLAVLEANKADRIVGTEITVSIRRGRWSEDTIEDDELGTVHDASWNEDLDWYVEAYMNSDGEIIWDESDQ